MIGRLVEVLRGAARRASRPLPALGIAVAAAFGPAGSRADGLDTLATAVGQTRPLVDIRLRSETVDQFGLGEEAEAVTARGRLGFETGQAWDTSLLAEADLNWPLVERYNSTVNGSRQYPVVADPENYALNRLQLANTSLPDTLIVVGRQRIVLDDQRFVGNDNWRQNEQTFDSARIVNTSIPNVTVDLTYLDRVNRIYGTDSPVGRYTGNSYLANVSYRTPLGKLTLFDYLLAFDQAPTDSSQTAGFRFAGKKRVAESLAVAYSVSWARQKDHADNPLRYEEDYGAGELTATYRGVRLGGGMERLQGDGVKGFSTPIATAHGFAGWADVLAVTPPNGLERRYATLGYEVKRIGPLDSLTATGFYHDFRSDRLDIHYGSEVDLQLLGKWRRLSGLLEYADYRADRFGADTRKIWIEIDYVRQ